MLLTLECGFVNAQTFFFGLSWSSGVPWLPSTNTLSPGLHPSGMTRGSTIVWSSLKINLFRNRRKHVLCFYYLEVHSTIPFDSTPLILAGLRLHKTATFRFFISSNGTNFASPLTTYELKNRKLRFEIFFVMIKLTVRGSPSPRSIFST